MCAQPAPLLKAFAAIHGTPLGRLERYGGFFATLRADRFGLHALRGCHSGGRPIHSLSAIRFAGLAALRLVLEALIGEKHLLAGSENEFRPALCALQNFVMVFHTLLRVPVRTGEAAAHLRSSGEKCIRLYPRTSLPRWLEAAWNDWTGEVP